MQRSLKYNSCLIILVIALFGCGKKPGGNISETGRTPLINPDYTDITFPFNIAPVNFIIKETGSSFYVEMSSGTQKPIRIKSKNGLISIPQKRWKNLLTTNTFKDLKIDIYVKQRNRSWTKFKTITNRIAPEPIDPFLSYRILYPGYESWAELSIQQRNLENFHERPIIENSVADENCVNCHSYNNGRSDDFLFHMRGSMGGTFFYSGGELKKTNLKTSSPAAPLPV